MKKELQIKYIDITKLITHPNNPRLLKDNQYKKAKKQMRSDKWEWLEPLVINKNHIINNKFVLLSGNQRYSIAHELFDEGYKKFSKDPN